MKHNIKNKHVNTSVDIYETYQNGLKKCVAKGIKNTLTWFGRLFILESLFDLENTDLQKIHRPISKNKEFEPNKNDNPFYGQYVLMEVKQVGPSSNDLKNEQIYKKSSQEKLKWFNFGYGGSPMAITSDTIEPKNFDITMYKMIPFRFTDNPLSEEESSQYGLCLEMKLRKKNQDNGNIKKYAYYLKKMPLNQTGSDYIQMIKHNQTNGLNPNDINKVDYYNSSPVYANEIKSYEMDCYVSFKLSRLPHECVEYFNFINGTNKFGWIDEAGLFLGNYFTPVNGKPNSSDVCVADFENVRLGAHIGVPYSRTSSDVVKLEFDYNYFSE